MKIDGIEVQDATRAVVLHIRDADTKSGKKDPNNCAAAKAACRVTGVVEARVFRTRTYLLMQSEKGKKVWKRYDTPPSIRNEIISFDRGGTFEPDDYTLTVVKKSQALGTPRPDYSRGPHKTKRPTPHVVKGIRPTAPKGLKK